jgi:hypothetical protein
MEIGWLWSLLEEVAQIDDWNVIIIRWSLRTPFRHFVRTPGCSAAYEHLSSLLRQHFGSPSIEKLARMTDHSAVVPRWL